MKGKSTKTALLMSFTSLLLCFAMLIGSTFAWFTDSVTSGVNKIVAGNLDVELYHATSGTVTEDDANKVTSTTQLFNIEHWEPGVVAYENFMVKNVGTLALKYQLAMTVGDFNTVDGHSLKEVLKVAVVPGGFSGDRAAAQALTGYTTLEQFSTSSNGALLPDAAGDVFGVVIYWEPTNHDNDYNLNNGKTATVVANKFTDKELGIELGIQLLAQQLPHEEDSFNNMYDDLADNTVQLSWNGESVPAALDGSNDTTYQIKVSEAVKASLTVPAGATVTKANGDPVGGANLKLVVKPGSNAFIEVDDGFTAVTFDASLVIAETGEAVQSNKPMKVMVEIGSYNELVKFYHKGTEYANSKTSATNVTEVGDFYYDVATGKVTFMTKDFSPFTSVYKFAGGIGDKYHPYLIANREQMQGITTEYAAYKYYKVADGVTTMDCTNWTPVKLHGSFDGNGIRLLNLDLGLFDSVNGAASVIKNMDITANMNRTAGVGAVVYDSNTLDLTIENVDVHGTITGATWVTPYVEFGPGPNYTWNVTFINCISDAALTATSGAASGFVGHPYDDVSNGSVDGKSLITVIDSAFVGNMSATGTKFASNYNFKYFTINGNDNRVKTRYSEEFIAKLGFNPEGTLYNTVKENANYPITSGEDGSKTFFAGNYGKNGADFYAYAGHLALLDNTPKATVPQKGEVFTVTKVAGAVKAKASLQISPNDANNFGSYTGTYLTEEIELTDGGTFMTNQVINFNIKINDGATVTGAVGDTFHVVGNAYGKNAHNGAVVFITQYDENDNVLNTTRLVIAEKHLAE